MNSNKKITNFSAQQHEPIDSKFTHSASKTKNADPYSNQSLYLELQQVRTDLENHKKWYTRKKCDQITTAHDLIKQLDSQVKYLQAVCETKADHYKVEQLSEKFSTCASISDLQALKVIVREKSDQRELDRTIRDLEITKDNLESFKVKQENFAKQLPIPKIFSEIEQIQSELEIRPTKDEFEKSCKDLEMQIEQIGQKAGIANDKYQGDFDHFKTKIDTFSTKFMNFEKKLGQKMEQNEAHKIWKYFERFAEYDDYKTLYQKCVPEIQKFEQKIVEFDLECKRNREILKQFDVNLSRKANRNQIDEFKNFAEENYMLKDEIKDLNDSLDLKITQAEKDLTEEQKDQRQILEHIGKNIKTLIGKEMKVWKDASSEAKKDHIDTINNKENLNVQHLQSLINQKASKLDVEMNLRQLSLLHSQIKSLIQLLTEEIKVNIESESKAGYNAKIQRVKVLQQSLLVSDQIMKTDLSQINDSFVSCLDIEKSTPFEFSTLRPPQHPKIASWADSLQSTGRIGRNLRVQSELKAHQSDVKRMSHMGFPSFKLATPNPIMPQTTTKRHITGKSISVALSKRLSDLKVSDLSTDVDKRDLNNVPSVTTQHKNIKVHDTDESDSTEHNPMTAPLSVNQLPSIHPAPYSTVKKI